MKVVGRATGQEILTIKGHAGGRGAWRSAPTAAALASASWDKTVRVWDAATGQEGLTLKGHTDGVTSVAFSPDGHLLASASADGTIKIWDARPLDPSELAATTP